MEPKLERMKRADEHISVGIAYASTGMEEEAISEFEKAVAVYPGHERAHYCLAKACFDVMRFDLAWRHARIAERLGFPVERLVNELAGISKEPANAAALPEEELKKESLEMHFRRGISYAEKGDFDGAMAELRDALKLAPKDGEVHQFLGAAYGEKGKREVERGRGKIGRKLFEKAWGHLRSAEGLGMDVSEMMRRLGRYMEEGEKAGEGATPSRS